ncbi:MAG TPA: STAS domain-containing protein [Terracidiphilus sp.]|nr:STAS domain-containing protein [Terracidiphilus sp.]
MQTKTKWHIDQLTSPAGHPVFVLRFDGDIAATSKAEFQGCYQSLPKESSKLILLDFSKVSYINSSGITLVIQLLMEAYHHAQKIYAFGLSPHFTKIFTVAGITEYAKLFRTQADAVEAF